MSARRELRELRAEVERLREELNAGRQSGEDAPDVKGRPAARRRRTARLPRLPVRALWWRHGTQARPLLVLTGLHGIGASGLSGWAVGAGLGAGAGAAWWAVRGRRRLDRDAERRYAAVCWLAGTGWLGAAGAVGAGPIDTWLWAAGGLLAVPWWVHHRVRPHRDAPAGWAQQIRERWAQRVAAPGGPLPASQLEEIREITGGWSATIRMDDDHADIAVARVKPIGARLQLRVDEIDIEPHPGGLHLARLLVQQTNPLAQVRLWPGPTLDPATGVSHIGRYADLQPVPYRHWRPGSGPVHTLIAGCTDSGKSTAVKLLLAEERHSGLVVSWLIDPQRGQSYPSWRTAVHRFAGTIGEARAQLLELRRRMYGRNAHLSRIRWVDDHGRDIEGVEAFTPGDPRHGLPLVSVTIDEAQRVLADEVCGPIVAELISMSRKCGIKFRLLVPVPLQGALGDSQEIKDAVAAGNVLVLRTANRLTKGAAMNGVLPVDPCELPKEWPGGATTSGLGFAFTPGADRPTKMRLDLIDDSHRWATSGRPAAEDDIMEPEPPAPGDAPEFTVHTGRPDEPDRAGRAQPGVPPARERVLGVFADGHEHSVADVRRLLPGVASRTVALALRQLTGDGLLDQPKPRGPYRITPAGRAHLTRRGAVA